MQIMSGLEAWEWDFIGVFMRSRSLTQQKREDWWMHLSRNARYRKVGCVPKRWRTKIGTSPFCFVNCQVRAICQHDKKKWHLRHSNTRLYGHNCETWDNEFTCTMVKKSQEELLFEGRVGQGKVWGNASLSVEMSLKLYSLSLYQRGPPYLEINVKQERQRLKGKVK